MHLRHPSRAARHASRRPKQVLAICGGGNGGHAFAVVASQNFDGEIAWLVHTEENAELLRQRVFGEGLLSNGIIVGRADKVRTISGDPAQVIPDADLVIIVVPAFAHGPILRQISTHLKESALVGSIPTRGGFEFEAPHFIPGIVPDNQRTIFGLQTLPWSTRVQEPGRLVNFGALKAKVLLATMPAHRATEVATLLTKIIGTEIAPTRNFLNMTLGNPGQTIHPGLMYGHFVSWAGEEYQEERIPRFYADATDAIGRVVAELSSDVENVAREIESKSGRALELSGVLSVHEWLRISYPTQTADFSSVGSCFRTGPLQHRKAPMLETSPGRFVPNFKYRYLSEDMPFGLAVTRAIAQLAGVATPTIDAVIRWTQEKLGKTYLTDTGLDGADAQSLPIPQNYGITSFGDLLKRYAVELSGLAASESAAL